LKQKELDPKQYLVERQIGYLLRVASQRHAAIFQQYSVMGLTPTQFSALIRISDVRECSQNYLGRLTSMDASTIKGVIGRLHKKGLVTHGPDPKDKRRKTIKLSEKAAAMIGQFHSIGGQISNETLRPLKESEKKRLLQLLQKIA
jgi:DNA-binding MarR family transcriptional regulator